MSYGLALALGLWVQGVDWIEARAQRDGAIWGAELAEVGRAPDARVWYLGHWGFQHYAERAGMQPLVPDRTALRPGDRLVVPTRVDRPDIVLRPDEAKTLYARSWNDPVPWTTIPGYYGGRLPVRGFRAPRLEVRVLEVLRPVVPPSDWSPSRLSTWARTAGGRTAAAAAPALFRIVETGRGEDRRIAMSGIVDLELQPAEYEPRLLAWSRDADPAIRLGAIVALARFPSPAAKAALEAARADEDPAVAEAARRLLGAGP